MTAFFYSLPFWLSAVLVLGLALVIGLGSSIGVQALFRLKPTEEEKEIAVNLMQVVAAYIGIMLAFSGVAVWQNFAHAETAVHQEVASAAELYRDLTIYGQQTPAGTPGIERLHREHSKRRVYFFEKERKVPQQHPP